MNIVVLTGSESLLGGRVADHLAHDPAVDAIVRLTPEDLDRAHGQPGSLKAQLEGATTLGRFRRAGRELEIDLTREHPIAEPLAVIDERRVRRGCV